MSNPQSRIHQDWRHAESARAAFSRDLNLRLDTVRRCATHLAERGIFVAAVDLRIGAPGKPVITVPPSPYLHILFKDDASSGRHWDHLMGRTSLDFVAVHLGCEVRWSEVVQ